MAVKKLRSHLLFAGGWEVCDSRRCRLLFHLDMAPGEAEALPMTLLYPLLEAIQPPTLEREGWKLWLSPLGYAHRDYDLPASIHVSGEMQWQQRGRKFRVSDRPARITADGTQTWYLRGARGRDGDKPAKIYPDGTQEWYKEGQRHRESGPAVVHPDGSEELWRYDRLLVSRVGFDGEFTLESGR